MKILIAGTQEYSDYEFLKETCLRIIHEEQAQRQLGNKYLEFITGGAKGGDALGEQFARCYGFVPKLFKANWNDLDEQPCFPKPSRYGLINAYAGFNRNQRMIDYITENGGGILIAFRINKSGGISDTIRRAKKAGVKVYQIDYDKNKKIKIWNQEVQQEFPIE